MLVPEHDIAWSKGRWRSICPCGWLSELRSTVQKADESHRQHRGSCPLRQPVWTPRPPRRHWHLAEVRSGWWWRPGAQRRRVCGTSSAADAYQGLASRVSQLVLAGWEMLDDETTDDLAVLVRRHDRCRIDVAECWDGECLAAHPLPLVGPA